MPENRAWLGVVIAALVGMLLAAGCSQSPSATPTVSAPTVTAPPSGNIVDLVDYSNNDLAQSKVVLTGAIGDFGEATSINADGSTNPDHNAYLELALSHGSFRIDIATLDRKIVSAFAHPAFDSSTCSVSVTATGTAPIVAGSGAGAYVGIKGNFDMTVRIAEVVPKSECNLSAAFLSQAVIMTGQGAVSLAP